MILTGKNLGERQRDLNLKVKEAAIQNVNFDEVKEENEETDIDRLFKIDLASKYKHLDYLIEVLKSGDNLYISRALKCIWLYDEEQSAIINPDYLHENIFPFMSIKMKKKMLTTISIYLKSESMNARFYLYCKTNNLQHIANKFIIYTSESFKLDIISDNIGILTSVKKENFIGNSFILADAYLNEISESQKIMTVHELRYMFSVDGIKYLDMLEKHVPLSGSKALKQLGLRISRNVMKRHKDRILRNPLLYVHVLNKEILIKHSTGDDAKIYLTALLPDLHYKFWSMCYGSTYDHLINLIPLGEKFGFIKNIFTAKYPGNKFETLAEFYTQNYHYYMTMEERETWALEHIASQDELIGPGLDYIWYKFVNFDIAFEEIKKILYVTPDANKRANIIRVLIRSASNHQNLEKLLNYYYDRHVNESRCNKEGFIDRVNKHHKIFELNEKCWTIYNKLLHSLEVYNVLDYSRKNDYHYRMIALIYHLTHNKDVPSSLKTYTETGMNTHPLKIFTDQLSEEKREVVYNYIFETWVHSFNDFENQAYNDDVKKQVRNLIHRVLTLMKTYNKPDDECPEIVKKYMQLDEIYNRKAKVNTLNEGQILRLLKQDASLVVAELPKVEEKIENSNDFRINQLVRKLKVYFKNDIAQDYLQLFMKLLTKPESPQRVYYTAVYGLMQLANEQYKVDLLTKYQPSDGKVDHSKIDRSLLYIQESICRFVNYSRVPVPLSNVLPYIKGDYIRYCLPMFNAYLSTIPPSLKIPFVESLLNKPVSVQKHGLRLAFKCFNTEDLKQLVLRVWKKTKHISLRMIVYTSLYNYIQSTDSSTAIELFQVLKTFTLDLHQDDHEDVLNILQSRYMNARNEIRGEFLVVAWQTVVKFSNRHEDMNRKVSVIENIKNSLEFVNKDDVKKIIDEYVHTVLTEKQLLQFSDVIYQNSELNRTKVHLIEAYISKYCDESSLALAKTIIKNCLEMFDEVVNKNGTEIYVARKFCYHFIKGLVNVHYNNDNACYSHINFIYEAILQELQEALPAYEIYDITWNIRTAIISNRVIDDALNKMDLDDEDLNKRKFVKRLAQHYASEFNELIVDLIEKQMFHKSFLVTIRDIVYNNLRNILKAPHISGNRVGVTESEMCIYVSASLIDFKVTESVLIAISILPSNYGGITENDYKSLLNALSHFENCEIQTLLYQKFVQEGFVATSLSKRLKIG